MNGTEQGVVEGSRRSRVRAVSRQLAFDLKKADQGKSSRFGRGDLADLRRMQAARGADPNCAAFWRIVVEDLEESRLVRENERDLQTWVAALQAAAELAGFQDNDVPLGLAMAKAGVAEGRLLQLLRADGDRRLDLVRTLAQQLHSKAQAVDLADIAELLLTTDPAAGETIRRRIASSYFRELRKQQQASGAAA